MAKRERNPEPSTLAESLAAHGHVCPVPLTHDRLDESHYWWHEMARQYHEPDPFRYSLGAFIQAARSITFMLQKEQAVFHDFSWYKEWVSRTKTDPVFTWLKSARTDLVHRSALETFSSLEMRCLRNPQDPHGVDDDPCVIRVSPFTCTHYYMTQGPQEDHAHEYTRQWGIDGLPGSELLEACAQAFDSLDDLVVLAHNKLHAEVMNFRTPGSKRNLPCMENTIRYRIACTVMRDGREVWEGEPPDPHEHS